jgi:hypothetical protein
MEEKTLGLHSIFPEDIEKKKIYIVNKKKREKKIARKKHKLS